MSEQIIISPQPGYKRKGPDVKSFKTKLAVLYRTTNLVNGCIYIGVETLNKNKPKNSYFGSGLKIKEAILSFGKENFKKEILVLATAEYCYELEKKLVNEEFISRDDTYNISVGGWGGSRGKDSVEKGKLTQKNNYHLLDQKEKDERKKFLKEILIGVDPVKGKEHFKWAGYWITPKGKFVTVRDAAQAHNINEKSVRNRCIVNNSTPIKNPWCIKDIPQHKTEGKTWAELGWGFLHKEVKDA